jgi:cytochrome c oxidase cbb3-type subunit I/II
MLIGATVLVLIGGLVEIMPMMLIDKNVPKIASVLPYTALELEGRDLYIREGCVGCHSQMVRPFRSETERYGEYSKSGEFIYDRPFLWGSKRTGPDLHRVGKKYPDSWHYNHMLDPETMSPGSIMPPYPWLLEDDLDTKYTAAKIKVLRSLNTPYTEGYEDEVIDDMNDQAAQIVSSLEKDGIEQENLEKKEIIALIAYLQRLGTDINPGK